MALPNPFTTIGPLSIVFNYEDFESGTGYVSYNGYNTEDDSGISYHLNKTNLYSDSVETMDLTTGVGTTPTFGKTLDISFNTSPFNYPRTINGNVIINSTAGFKFNSSNNVNYRLVFTLYIVNSSGETQIGQVTTRTETAASNNSWKSTNFSCLMEISNKLVKEKEWLKLQVQYYANTSVSASAVDTIIGHSPFDISGNIDPSSQDTNYNKLKINIPYLRE